MKINSKFKKVFCSILAAACVSSAAFGIAGCMPKSIDKSEPEGRNVKTDRATPPTDGSLPTAYSAAENLAYIVGKFDSQTQFHTYTEGVTAAAIATQVTKNWKDYKDGVLVNSDITYSSMVKTGTQSCTVIGKDENGNPKADTYFRLSETPSANSTSTTAVWKQDAPTYFSENAYNYTYGLLPTELFNYAVNKDTIISSDEIKVESNGTYTLNFTLDNEDSTFFYQFGMKTRGGLSDYPEFQQIKFSVNFNADWQINTTSVHEVSKINKGIVVSSVSDFTTVYYYGEDNFDDAHYGYYESYYKKYLGDSSLNQGGDVDDELVMDVTNVLSNGFATILNGGQQFEISANLGANKYVGYIFLGLDLADIAGSINLKLSLGKTLKEQTLFVEYANGEMSAYYGEDFALYANLAAVKLELDNLAEIINGITTAVSRPSSGGESGAEESGSDPLAALMASMVLEAGENSATLTLNTDDLMGLGIGIDAKLVFGISGNTITFRGADVGGLAIGGQTLDLNLSLTTTTAPLISRNPSKTPVDLNDYVADIYKLLSSDLIKVSAELNGDSGRVQLSALKGVNVKVDAYADLNGIALGADATASYTYNGNTISVKLSVLYEYNQNTGTYGNAYLSLKELNGVAYDLNVRCDVNELVNAISAMLNQAGTANSFQTGKLVSALNSALSSDFSSLLTEMYADGTKIKIGVSIDTVMDMLGVDAGVKFGSCTLAYERGEGVYGGNLSASLPSIGFAMNVCGVEGELTKPNDEDYLDLNDILEDVKAFIDAKAASVGIHFDGSSFTAMEIPELKDLTANATIYVDFNNNLAAQIAASVAYKSITASITADYIYDSATNGTVILTLTELCGVERNVKLYCQVNEVVEGVKTLLTYFGTTQSAEATQNTASSAININDVLANLLTADINALIPNLEASANVLNLTVDVDEVLNLLGVQVTGLTIGEVALEYNHVGENLLTLNAPNFGLTANVNPYNTNIEAASTEDALNLKDVLGDVNAIMQAKKLAVVLNFNGANFSAANVDLANLTASATAYVDFTTGLAAQVNAQVAYGNITASITADYIYDSATNGTVILTLTELCGVERNVKLYCQVNEVVEGVKTLLTYFGTTQSAEATQNTASSAININDVLANLLTADINALIPNLEASANVLNLTVDVDEVLKLLNVSVNGLTIGEVALEYNHVGENLLTLNAPNFGLTAKVNPYNTNIEAASTEDALNLKDVLGDVNAIMQAKKLAVVLNFNGANFSAANVDLANLTASATAYVDFTTGLAAQVNASVSYKVDEGKFITATIKVYFNYDNATIGDVFVVLDSINGVATSAKVRCNITELKTAIETLIAYVTPKNEAVSSTESTAATDTATQTAASVLDKLITADLTKLLTDINAQPNVFNLTVNVDEILNLFDLNTGLTLGDATLEYNHSTEGERKDLLTLSVANAGLTLTVNTSDYSVNIPTDSDWFDLTLLIDVVNDAISQINTIKENGKLYFEIAQGTSDTPATYLYLDGICVEIWGKGEISWKAGEERIALDLYMSITETGTDITSLKLVYDKNSAPLVKLALNDVGLNIYQEDIDGVKNGFIEIYNKLAGIFGLKPIETGTTNSGAAGSTTETTTAASTSLGSADKLLALVFNLLASDDWVNEINNFTASVSGKSVAIGYLTDANKANVAISTDGKLSVAYDGAFGERFSLGGIISVSAAGETPLAISFSGCNMASSKDGTVEFIRLAYNFLFESIHGISVENILGSSTYAVTFELNGANTEVADMKDVYVKAEIYVTDEASINDGKLAEGLLVLDVAGVAINLHVITEYDDLGKAKFYINLTQVGNILLPDLKLLATQDSLYETFKVLFNTINDTNVLNVVSKLLPASGTAESGTVEQPTTGESQQVTEGTLDKVASVLEKLLNLNFSAAVNAYEIEGVQYADIDLDNLLGQLGLNVGTLGNLKVEINHNDHSMKTSGVAMITNSEGVKEAKEWISLSSAKTSKRSYSSFKREDYINIEFLPYLIEDIVKFATDDNGNIYEKYTLSGAITANIVNMFNINIDVANLTISMADNDFYFSGVLHVKKMSALGLVTIPESTVGISFHGGYLTLARGLNGSTPEYRIMTMDYFMDHMLVKADNDCVLKWWLNVSGWDTVMSIINSAAGDLNVESGLTRAENVYLYDQSKKGQTQLISMYDYVEALKVMVNGKEYASFGDMSALEKEFGVYDNYYGFSLNARKVTGDVLTKLYAAIIRDENGISAVKASGAIDSYVTFSATLNYNEGATEDYVIGNSLQSALVAPSMYTAANAIITAQGLTVDYDHFVKNAAAGYDEKFGCFNLYYNSANANYDASYNYSNILYQHTLTIVNLDGTTETRQVRQGSTIYLYDNDSPIYTDDSKEFRLLYTTQAGVIGATSVIMDTDLTVYALRVKAVDVVVISGSSQYKITSFVGDKVPTMVEGLETIGAVTYEDGTIVGENDVISEELLNGASTFNVYGTFVQSIVEVNGINYEFTYDNSTASGYYTVVGKASNFNTTLYCGANGRTLVLENEIGGYPVMAIGAEALANYDGHALRSVVVPSNIVSVGERAFLDNIGMEEVVFLAENVTLYGKAGSSKTMPFYGCSVLSTDDKVNGQEGNEVTYLYVYYNNITSASGENWRHFRHVSKVFSFNSYIGEDGGATISSGWDYVTASTVVELNGITGSALTQATAEEIISRYYPLVREDKFTGSAEIETSLAVDFAQFDMTKNGITYTCSIFSEYSTVDGFTHVTYTINYTKAKIIYVYSDYEITYYGTNVPAQTKTKITIPVTDEEFVLETPTEYTHKFVEWNIATENGEEVYNIVWAEKATYSLKIRLTRGGVDTNIVHILENGANEKTIRINGNVWGGTADVTSIKIYEGQATFTLKNNILTVVTGNKTYTIFVNDAEVTGSDKGIQRVISSSITGTQTVSGDMTVTFAY